MDYEKPLRCAVMIALMFTCAVVSSAAMWLQYGAPANILSLTGASMVARECGRSIP